MHRSSVLASITSFCADYCTLVTLIALTTIVTSSILILDAVSSHAESPFWPDEPMTWRCEGTGHGRAHNFLHEPANAMSNLVFSAVGGYAVLCAIYDYRFFRDRKQLHSAHSRRNSITSIQGGYILHPILSLALGFALFFIAMGSFLYHASSGTNSLFVTFDLYGIFVICFAFLFLLVLYPITSILSHRPNLDKATAVILTALWFACCLTFWWGWDTWFWPGWDYAYIMLLSFMAVMLSSLALLFGLLKYYKIHCTWMYSAFSLLSITIAIVAWVPEELNGKCVYLTKEGEYGWLQLHGIWHAFLAVSIFWIFAFVRSIGIQEVLKPKFGLTRMQFLLLKEIRTGTGTGAGKKSEQGWAERAGEEEVTAIHDAEVENALVEMETQL
jgi:hypothetical protein